MSRLTRDGTAEPVSRDQILRHARGQGNILSPVQLTTSRIGNLTRLIHTLLYVMTIHTYIHTSEVRISRVYQKHVSPTREATGSSTDRRLLLIPPFNLPCRSRFARHGRPAFHSRMLMIAISTAIISRNRRPSVVRRHPEIRRS